MSVLMVLAGYLVGSIPWAYVAGRMLRGIDIRRYGSGNVGGSNVFEHVGKWAVVPVGLLDIAKAALPVWLAVRWGFSDTVVFLTAMAAIAGHGWPLYLGFRGGRGVSASLGALCIIMPEGALLILVSLFIGRLLKAVGLLNLLGILGLPPLAWALHKPSLAAATGWGIIAITVLKRLEANRVAKPADYTWRRVLMNRLLFDRDIDDRDTWVKRTPDDESS